MFFILFFQIKDKEVECGGAPPRVLVLDDYFMAEVEKIQKDPDTGKRVKTKVSLTQTRHSVLTFWVCITSKINNYPAGPSVWVWARVGGNLPEQHAENI